MITKDGKFVVYLAIERFEDFGAKVISIHDTRGGAVKALEMSGYRPGGVFTLMGELYAYRGKTADEYPYGAIHEMEVKA